MPPDCRKSRRFMANTSPPKFFVTRTNPPHETSFKPHSGSCTQGSQIAKLPTFHSEQRTMCPKSSTGFASHEVSEGARKARVNRANKYTWQRKSRYHFRPCSKRPLAREAVFFCDPCERYLLVIRFQVEEHTVLFVTDHRVQAAIRIRTLRVEGPDFTGCYFPRNRASQRARRSPPGNGSQRWTDSEPEALKLLVVSNNWRRNVPPSSRRSR